MKTDFLFEIPQSRASKQSRITEFKEKHHILTYRTKGIKREDHPWMACLVHEEDRRKDLFTICAESCRSYDEAGLLVTGEGELSAIRTLCEQNKIPCDL